MVKKNYDIEQGNTVLYLEQTGELKGDSTGSFDIKLRRKVDNGALKSFNESVNYNPSY